MPKMNLNCAWLDTPYELDKEYPYKVEILIDKFKREFVPEGEVRIVILWEPTGYLIPDVMMYPDFYSYVFTYHQFILDNNSKARLFLGITMFVDHNISHNKIFGVSSVIGDKQSSLFPGYAKRHELWFKRNKITMPIGFFVSGADKFSGHSIVTPYGTIDVINERRIQKSKDEVFDHMFHIAIENAYANNFFTEKIVDCFATRTIPIYIGAENISEFFNSDGIISVKTVDEAIGVCNSLSEDYYHSRKDAIEDNYQRSLKYYDYNKMLTEKVMEVLPCVD